VNSSGSFVRHSDEMHKSRNLYKCPDSANEHTFIRPILTRINEDISENEQSLMIQTPS